MLSHGHVSASAVDATRDAAASRVVTREARRLVARCWSRSLPARPPVARAAAQNTNRVSTSVGEPIWKL